MLAVNARRFRPKARVALFLAAQGRCNACGAPLRARLARRPRQAGERRRRDRARERPGAVPAVQPREGRTAVVITPRPWQAEFLARHARAPEAGLPARRDPGCRQDARRVPRDPRRRRRAGRGRLPDHRAASAVGRRGRRVGLHLDPRWRNADGAWRADVDGVVVTYQQVASGAGSVRPPSRAPDVRGARRGPSRGRVGDLGHRAARRVRRRAPPARAVRHAVPLGRTRDPVRALRRRAPLRARLRLRLRRGRPRRRLPSARVPAARRDAALARRRAGDDRGLRRRARRDRRRTPAAHRDRPAARRCCRRCCATPTRC